MRIRWGIRKDMPEIYAIENEAYGTTAWPESTFSGLLHQRNVILQVCEGDPINLPSGKVVNPPIFGFMIYEMLPKRYDILNIAVHPAYQRIGVGHALLEKLRSRLCTTRRNTITALSSEYSDWAHAWLKKEGFQAIRVHRGIDVNGNDAYEFRWHIKQMVTA